MSVSDNLARLKNEIPAHVTLVAVSKTKPVGMIRDAYEAGHRDFGENYVQELTEKHSQLPADIRWHFIGHLQSNKVKYIASFVHLIHGIDSLRLLKEVNKQGAKHNRVISVLLQVHIAQEETKFGLSFDECRALLNEAATTELPFVAISGLMAMASNTDDMQRVRREFCTVKDFHSSLQSAYPGLRILSYGMSSDYREAIAAGSNLVRIGSLIFGERQYT